MSDLTAVSLFAGVGGIDLALERAGVTVTAAVEIDDAARGVLADRFPGTHLFTDVTKVTADELRATGFVPERGIVAAGWPCQGNSVAGGRGGLADPRSGLWRHVVRLLAELSPRWFLGENVPGLLSVTEGEDFGIVLDDLAELGMGFAYRVMDAQFFGVPQRRRRVFVVGDSRGTPAGPVSVLLEPEGGAGNPSKGRAPGQGITGALTGGPRSSSCANPDDNRAQAGFLVPVTVSGSRTHALTSEGADASKDGTGRGTPIIAFHLTQDPISSTSVVPAMGAKSTGNGIQTDETTVRRLTPLECERLQGFPDNHTATSNGKPQADSARYRQMGNAVAVPCVEWIARRIVRTHAVTKAQP